MKFCMGFSSLLGYVYFTDMNSIEMASADDCELDVLQEKFSPLHFCVALQKNSAYTAVFSERHVLHSGIFLVIIQ